MPNKRADNKVSMGVYVDKELRDMVKVALANRGLTLTEFLYGKLVELLLEESEKVLKEDKKHGKKIKKEHSENRKK